MPIRIIIMDDALSGPKSLSRAPRKKPKKIHLKKRKPIKSKPKYQNYNKPNRFVRGSARSDN